MFVCLYADHVLLTVLAKCDVNLFCRFRQRFHRQARTVNYGLVRRWFREKFDKLAICELAEHDESRRRSALSRLSHVKVHVCWRCCGYFQSRAPRVFVFGLRFCFPRPRFYFEGGVFVLSSVVAETLC